MKLCDWGRTILRIYWLFNRKYFDQHAINNLQMIVKAILTKCRRINLLLTDSQKRRCVHKAKLLSSHFQAKVGKYIVSKLLLHSSSGISEKLWSKFFFKMHQCSEIQKKFYVYVQVHILFRKVAALFATSKDIFSNLCNILLIHALFFAQFSH